MQGEPKEPCLGISCGSSFVGRPHTKRKFKYGKELCPLVERSAKARHEEH